VESDGCWDFQLSDAGKIEIYCAKDYKYRFKFLQVIEDEKDDSLRETV